MLKDFLLRKRSKGGKKLSERKQAKIIFEIGPINNILSRLENRVESIIVAFTAPAPPPRSRFYPGMKMHQHHYHRRARLREIKPHRAEWIILEN